MFLRRLKSTYARSLYETLKTEETIFEKQVKFFDFCKNMAKLEKLYEEEKQVQFFRVEKLKRIALSSKEPVRDALEFYSLNRKDFSSELLVDTLEYLGKILKSKDYPAFSDYSFQELIETPNFQVLIKDIYYGLNGDEYIPPLHLSKIAISLADMKYKDSDLFLKLTERIKAQINDSTPPPSREIYKYHIYSGFINNEEFKEHVNVLLDWKAKAKLPEAKVMQDIQNFTESIHDLKYLQKNFASAIANITEQYYLLVSAQQTYEFLKNNDQITLGLNHLQEVLVSAGILNPYELDDAENLENLEKLMQRAEKTFTNVVAKYYPYLNSPMIDELYEASKDFNRPELPLIEKPLVPNANTVSAEVFGNLSIALGRIIHLEKGDVNEKDYPNEPWRFRAKPSSHKLEEKGTLYIDLPYTKIWVDSKKFLQEMIPEIRKVSKNADMASACNLLYGLGICHISDKEVLDNLHERISLFQEQVDIDILANAIYGIGLANSHPKTAELLVKILGSHPEFDQIGFNSLIKCIWGQCVHQLYDSAELPRFLETFSNFEVLKVTNQEAEILKEVLFCIDLELKHLCPPLNFTLNLAKAYVNNGMILDTSAYYNPLKPLLRKVGRFIMSQGITDTEARLFHKKLLANDPFPVFKCDDIIGLSGFKVLVFFVADEGVYQNHLLGNYQLKLRILERLGMRGLPLPIYQILNVDPVEAKISFNSLEPINDFVSRFIGIPKNILEPLDNFTSDLIVLLRDDYHPISNDINGMLFLEEMLGAYKIQSTLKTKIGIHLYNHSLEEMKLQFYKLYNRFLSLDEKSQQAINEIVQKNSEELDFLEFIKDFSDSLVTEYVPEIEFWTGLRQRMHLPTNKKKADITDEVINQRFLMLSNYFQYDDWAQEINKAYPINNDLSLYEDDLYNNFYFIHRRQQVGMLPNPNQKTNFFGIEIGLETRIKVFLSNLKYEIKRNLSDAEIIQKVLNLDFIDRLIQEHLSPKEPTEKVFLERDPAGFSGLYSDQIKVTEDNDHYVKFYREIYGQEAVKKELITKYLKNIQSINRKTDFSPEDKAKFHEQMLRKYTNTKEALDYNEPERGIYMDPIFRQSFDYKTDPKTLRIRKTSIRDDHDFSQFAHDQDFLDFKRVKAETNLIKLKIFLKLHNDLPLSALEEAYLKEYRSALKFASIHNAGSVFLPSSVTSMTFADLSDTDKSFVQRFRKTKMPEGIERLSLNELILELAHFFDDHLIKRIEFNYVENRDFEDWKITPDPTGGSKLKPMWNNKGLWVQNSAMEEYMWRKAGDMTEKDEKNFLDLFGTFRGKGFPDILYWKMDLGSYKELMEEAKGSDFKMRFLRQWYRRKFTEFKLRKTVPDGKFALPDKQIFEWRKEETRKKYGKDFENWIGIKVQDVNENNINKVLEETKKIVTVDISEKNLNLIRIVYFHPELKDRNWEDLDAMIKNYKVPVYEGNYLFEKPIPVRGDRLQVEISKEEWEQRIENASINFLPGLIQKILKS